MTQPTGGPWKVCGRFIVDPDQETIAEIPEFGLDYTEQHAADAAHIVKCVNLHDELVKALNDLSLEAIGFVGQADPADHGHTNINVLNRKIEVARALVAKAEAK